MHFCKKHKLFSTLVLSIFLSQQLAYSAEKLSTPAPAAKKINLELSHSNFADKPYKSAALAGTLSIIPGLGHLYLGDDDGALTHLLVGLGSLALATPYSMYAAYRDARTMNGESAYRFRSPKDSFYDIATAPFSWSVISKPEVWGGTLGFLGVGLIANYFLTRAINNNPMSVAFESRPANVSTPIRLLAAGAISFYAGTMEESLFRGFLQPAFSEVLGQWGGLVFASALFGLAHTPNVWEQNDQHRMAYYTYGIPTITLGGAYMGWLSMKNHSLRESVAVHFWYDFAIFSIAALASGTIGMPVNFNFSIPF